MMPKFRVWRDNKMYYPEKDKCHLKIYGNKKGIIPWGLYDDEDGRRLVTGDPDAIFNTPGVLMQWTGLKDKNDVDIYESDVVEAWSEGYKHVGEIRWRLEGQPAIIIYPAFANQGFWKIHGQKNLKGEWVDDGVKVIGNIYANPGLIPGSAPGANL